MFLYILPGHPVFGEKTKQKKQQKTEFVESGFDPVIQQAAETATKELAKDDAKLSPKELGAKRETLAKLDSVVENRLAEKPQDFAANHSAAGYQLRMGGHDKSRYAKAGELAGRAYDIAMRQGKPDLAARALVSSGLARFLGDPSPEGQQAAHQDGCGALKIAPGYRPALELCKYTDHRITVDPASTERFEAYTRRMRELAGRSLAMQDPGRPHTMEAWAARQETDPSEATELVWQSVQRAKAKDWGGALKAAQAAIQADPGDAMAWLQSGNARRQLKDYNGAILDLSRVVAMGWEDETLYKSRADALFFAGHYAYAEQDASMALAYAPKDAFAYFVRATARMKLGRHYGEVLEDLKLAAEIDPRFAREYGIIKSEVDRFGPAITQAKLKEAEAESAAAQAKAVPESPAQAASAFGNLRMLWGAGAVLALLLAAYAWGRAGAGKTTAASAPPAADEERLLGGRYRLGRVVGQGGMGVVREAWDLKLNRRVAVKVPLDGSPEARRRVLEEAEKQIGFAHPNAVAVFDRVEEGGMVHLVLPFVEGKTAAALLQAAPGGRLVLERVWDIIDHVCRAVSHAHAAGVIHRDLKPGNIMTTEDGGILVMDFGLARLSGDTALSASGTPAYMAPEARLGKFSAQSDIFSLGVTAYELLTGKRPFSEAGALGEMPEPTFTPPSELVQDLPPGLDGVLRKALSPNPAERFREVAGFMISFRQGMTVK